MTETPDVQLDPANAVDQGQVAYEAYCQSTGGRSAITGEPLPAWADQKREIREAWRDAAAAVARLYRLDLKREHP